MITVIQLTNPFDSSMAADIIINGLFWVRRTHHGTDANIVRGEQECVTVRMNGTITIETRGAHENLHDLIPQELCEARRPHIVLIKRDVRPHAARPKWSRYAHHATVNMGTKTKGPMADVELNTPVKLIATELGLSDKAMAIKVEGPDFKTKNKIPHITVAVAPGARPVDSNKITEWTPLETPLVLHAILQEVERDGVVSYTAAVLIDSSTKFILKALGEMIPA